MSWITTGVGRTRFDYYKSTAADIHPQDVITSLARTPRFRGMGLYFYSVAQHSMLVGYLMMINAGISTLKELQRDGVSPKKDDYGFRLMQIALLHDGTEVYMADVAQPLKQLLPGYKAIEKDLAPLVYGRFGVESITEGELAALQRADMQACLIERDFLFPQNGRDWETEGDHPGFRFGDFFQFAWDPNTAAHNFELYMQHFFPWMNGNANVH